MTLLRSTPIKKLAAVALAAIFALACGAASKPANPSDPLPIRIGYTPGGVTRLYTAMSMNLFEKHRLQAELIPFQSGVASAAAFKSGSIDIALAGVPGFASARLSSDAQVFLVEANDDGAVSLVVQPGSTINSPKDLTGKNVGTAIGTNPYVGLVLALNKAGVQPSAVNFVNLAPNTWVPAFQARQVDALFAWGPANYQLIAGGAKPIATLKDYIPSPIVWMGRPQFLSTQDGAKAAGRFIEAMDEAGKLFKTNENKMIDYMAQQKGIPATIIKSEVADISYLTYADEAKPTYQWSLVKPGAGLQPVIDQYVSVLVQAGVLATKPSFTNAYNAKPLTLYVNSQLG
jgi:ABC-type nitrate/sulfonate/bicarbonate transport system substrate-binding protein